MKVLMVMQHINFFRNLDTVVRELGARGHEVVLLHGTELESEKGRRALERKRETMVFMGRGIEVAKAEVTGVTVGYRPEPAERWQRKLRAGRQVVNRAIYLRKGHPSPVRVVGGLEKRFSPRVKRLFANPVSRAILRSRLSLALWRRLEVLGRPSRSVVDLIGEIAPDVVLVSPTIWPKEPVEADYVRAARKLRIPTIGYLNSWDNLTSKGTIHVLPDVYVVWNEPLADEAVEIHDVPRKRIRITGAAHLDRFFEFEPAASREEIARRMGNDPDRPYLVYLCSSRTLIASEVELVTRLADALERRFGGAAPTVIVRPHPTNPAPWDDYDRPGVVVFPKRGDQADTPESWQEYYDQLSGAVCMFGLNTTAFLESVVADRPCLTIVSDEFYDSQGSTGHFRHLLKADFLEVSSNVDEVAERIARILDGADEKAAGRRYFTEWFLRPCGLDRPATLEVVDTIESAARLRGRRPHSDQAESVPELVAAAEDPHR
jgi:hypothetical protein